LGCAMPFAHVRHTPLENVRDNYLTIVTGICGLFGGTGSAVVLRRGVAVTNAHVAMASRRMSAFSSTGSMIAVEVIACSPALDLAVLGVPADFGGWAPLGRAVAAEPVWAMGTTDGRSAPTAAGLIEHTSVWAHTDGALHSGLMYSAPAGPGYSGGPLVNGEGRIVGITEGVFTRFFDDTVQARYGGRTLLFAYRVEDVLAEVDRLLAGRARPESAA